MKWVSAGISSWPTSKRIVLTKRVTLRVLLPWRVAWYASIQTSMRFYTPNHLLWPTRCAKMPSSRASATARTQATLSPQSIRIRPRVHKRPHPLHFIRPRARSTPAISLRSKSRHSSTEIAKLQEQVDLNCTRSTCRSSRDTCGISASQP